MPQPWPQAEPGLRAARRGLVLVPQARRGSGSSNSSSSGTGSVESDDEADEEDNSFSVKTETIVFNLKTVFNMVRVGGCSSDWSL